MNDGKKIGVGHLVDQLQAERNLTRVVPKAAHDYARHFERLRYLVREIGRAGRSVIRAADVLRGALDGTSLVNLQSQVRDSLSRLHVQKRLLSQADLSPAQVHLGHFQECLLNLIECQDHMRILGSAFVDHVREMKVDLGHSFALGLVRHLDVAMRRDPQFGKAWLIHCEWWSKNDLDFPEGISEYITSNTKSDP